MQIKNVVGNMNTNNYRKRLIFSTSHLGNKNGDVFTNTIYTKMCFQPSTATNTYFVYLEPRERVC